MRIRAFLPAVVSAAFVWSCGAFYSSSTNDPLVAQFSEHGAAVLAVAVSLDQSGKYVLSGDADGGLLLWDRSTGKTIRQFISHNRAAHDRGVYDVAFVPGSLEGRSLLVSGNSDGTARVWDRDTAELVYEFNDPGGWVYSVAVSPDGQTLVSGDSWSGLRFRDLTNDSLLHTVKLNDTALDLTYSPDGAYVFVAGHDAVVTILDATTGLVVRELVGHGSYVTSVAVTSESMFVASGSTDNTIRIWDVATGDHVRTIPGHSLYAWAVRVDPERQFVTSVSWDDTLRTFRFDTGEVVREIAAEHGRINDMAMTPDGRYVLTAGNDGVIRVWRTE
jgi:WD40 repeat protein